MKEGCTVMNAQDSDDVMKKIDVQLMKGRCVCGRPLYALYYAMSYYKFVHIDFCIEVGWRTDGFNIYCPDCCYKMNIEFRKHWMGLQMNKILVHNIEKQNKQFTTDMMKKYGAIINGGDNERIHRKPE